MSPGLQAKDIRYQRSFNPESIGAQTKCFTMFQKFATAAVAGWLKQSWQQRCAFCCMRLPPVWPSPLTEISPELSRLYRASKKSQ